MKCSNKKCKNGQIVEVCPECHGKDSECELCYGESMVIDCPDCSMNNLGDLSGIDDIDSEFGF